MGKKELLRMPPKDRKEMWNVVKIYIHRLKKARLTFIREKPSVPRVFYYRVTGSILSFSAYEK